MVFEQILYFEERLFKDSLFLGMKEAEPKRWPKLEDPSQITDEIAQAIYQAYEEGQIKLSREPEGMMPMGDRTVNWRYTRPVFKNSTREMLDLSIAARNAREDGLSQEYCLRMQHPDMTDKEIQGVMSGFSPRVVENAGTSINLLVQLYQQFMSIPDPQDPTMPWGVRLGIGQMLDEALLTLQKELAYGRPQYDPAESSPSINDAATRLRLSGGSSSVSAPDGSSATTTSPTGTTPNPVPPTGYPAYSPAGSMVAYGLPPTAPVPTDPTAGAVGRYWQDSGLPTGTGQPTIPAPGATVTQSGSVFGTGYGNGVQPSGSAIPAGIPAEFISNPYLWSLYAAEYADGGTGRKPGRRRSPRDGSNGRR